MQEGVEIIGESAFEGCAKLKNVDMPQSLVEIRASAFSGPNSLESITIPPKVVTISVCAFYDCVNLKEIHLSENTKEILAYAFLRTKFSEIYIPKSVEKISENAFSYNTSLNNIIIEGTEPKFVYESGMLMPKEKNEILFASDKYLKSISTFEIPEGIDRFYLEINQYRNINKLIISNSLTEKLTPRALPDTIQDVEVKNKNKKFKVDEEKKILYTQDTKELNMCFSKEENIDLLDENNEIGIQSISDSAFCQATNAKNIILPKSNIVIDSFAFQNCVKLESLKIGENVSKISGLFNFLNYNGKVTIDPSNNYYQIENNILYTKNKEEIVCALYPIEGEFKIDSEVVSIGDYAFQSQSQMTNIVFQKGLKKIGESFRYCYSLTELNIPSSIESISTSAFDNCNNIEIMNIQRAKDSISGAPWGAPKGMKVVNWRG